MYRGFSILSPPTPESTRAQKRAVLKQNRSLPHAVRRLYHLLMGLMCFSLYAWVLDWRTACILIAAIGGPFVLLDVLRLKSPSLKRLALHYFGTVMRRNELLGLTANSFFILGLFTVVLLFPKPIALLSILFLAIGDPVAAFAGTRYGKHRILGRKTWEGAFANFFVSGAAAAAFGAFYLGETTSAWVVGIVGAFVSMIAELVPFPIDDNFSVPVLSALQLSLVHLVLPLY